MKKIQDQLRKAEEEKQKQRMEDKRRHEEQMKKLQDKLAGAGHFYIWGAESGKVLDASVAEPGRVYIHDFHGGHNQQWKWNGDTLRNRRFPDKVLARSFIHNVGSVGKVNCKTPSDLPH